MSQRTKDVGRKYLIGSRKMTKAKTKMTAAEKEKGALELAASILTELPQKMLVVFFW